MSGLSKKHESETGNCFCAVTHDLELAEDIKSAIRDYKKWAWIRHEADTDEGTPHVHFLIITNGTRSIKHISDKIGLPSNYIQVCRKVVAFRRYMMHLDCDDKIKYNVHDVVTNCHSDFRIAYEGNTRTTDVYELFKSFRSLASGRKSADEFIQENYVEMSNMSFSQKIKTFEIIIKTERNGSDTT